MNKRIPADRVVQVQKPALVASGTREGNDSMTVIPLVEGDRVAGLEVRCSCGSHAIVDCVYDAQEQEQ